mgnify:CR=1 FL=1
MTKEEKMNAKSFTATTLIVLPVISLGNLLGASDWFIAGFASIAAFVLMCFFIVWNVSRLRNAGKTSWWALALIPPLTLPLILYNCYASSAPQYKDKSLYMYGIRFEGFWRILLVVSITLFLVYLFMLFMTFLNDDLS